MAALDLPAGPRGRLLAIGLTLAVLGGGWAGLVAPLLDWYAMRAEEVQARRAVARRMAEIAESLPALRDQARQAAEPTRAATGAVLEGASDPIAAAELQGRLQQMAARAGAPLSSAEALPGEAAGAWRRIGLRIAVNAPWPAVVRLLQAVATATPRMLVDDLQLRAPALLLRTGPRPMDASFTVYAFRAAEAAR
ncbi:type II secretion system protein GspM [Paracraurococcus lichenis]|uniref:Type II secretion system protein GspM n=1 Tax=Paracraurococcus lichenis TaxID=3064888 RepID=A0ABT9E7Z6_9PROT|nr:type II secretion system protein GspM [Paracraurococcus sp. LOR1-02]MDO9712294.1 type II secretion system protein GspM [Paracraurococcus sp. LOR1-02]